MLSNVLELHPYFYIVSAVCFFFFRILFHFIKIPELFLFFFCSPVDGHLDCFRFGGIMNKAAVSIVVLGRHFSFLLSEYLGMELLDHVVLKNFPKCLGTYF